MLKTTQIPDDEDSAGLWESAAEEPSHGASQKKLDALEVEIRVIKQQMREQEELSDEVIRSLRQEIAELRELITNAFNGFTNATHKLSKESGESTSTSGKQSGKLSSTVKKVLKGIARLEYADEDPIVGAAVADIAEHAKMELDEVMDSIKELAALGLVEKTEVEHEWALSKDAREMMSE
jgi:DNA-binding MarR family transcriptional regulator